MHVSAVMCSTLFGVAVLYGVVVAALAADIGARLRDLDVSARPMAASALQDWILLIVFITPVANILVVQAKLPIVIAIIALTAGMAATDYLARRWAPKQPALAISRGALAGRAAELARKAHVTLGRVYLFRGDPWIPSYGSSPFSIDLVLTRRLTERLNRGEIDALLARQIGYRAHDEIIFAGLGCQLLNAALGKIVPPIESVAWMLLLPVEVVALAFLISYRDAKADAAAVRIARNPEALITAVAKADRLVHEDPWILRILQPLSWRAEHIAKGAGISQCRLAELLERRYTPGEELYLVDDAALAPPR